MISLDRLLLLKGTANYETFSKGQKGSIKRKLYDAKVNPDEPYRSGKSLVQEMIHRDKYAVWMYDAQVKRFSEFQCQVIKTKPGN